MTPQEQASQIDLGANCKTACLRWHVLQRRWLDVIDIDHGIATCLDQEGEICRVANLFLVEEP